MRYVLALYTSLSLLSLGSIGRIVMSSISPVGLRVVLIVEKEDCFCSAVMSITTTASSCEAQLRLRAKATVQNV